MGTLESLVVYCVYGLVGILLGIISDKIKLKKTSYLFYAGAVIEFICVVVLMIDNSSSNDLGAALWTVLVVLPLYVIGIILLIINFIKRKKKK